MSFAAMVVQWGRVTSLACTGIAAFIAGIFVHRFYRMLRPSDPAIAGVALAIAKAKMSVAAKRYPAKMVGTCSAALPGFYFPHVSSSHLFQVFVVRNDLKMGKGKMCGRCSAVFAFFRCTM